MQAALLAVATALGVVFVAEFGDKSQVLLVAQAARARPWRVLAEATLAFAVLTALAVSVGALVARLVPQGAMAVASGALFVLFGALAVREARRGMEAHEEVRQMRYGVTFALVVAAEMGDKTQFATAALAAASGQAFATGLGSWLAESASALLAVLAGSWLTSRLPTKAREYASAALFFAVGLATAGWGVWLLVR